MKEEAGRPAGQEGMNGCTEKQGEETACLERVVRGVPVGQKQKGTTQRAHCPPPGAGELHIGPSGAEIYENPAGPQETTGQCSSTSCPSGDTVTENVASLRSSLSSPVHCRPPGGATWGTGSEEEGGEAVGGTCRPGLSFPAMVYPMKIRGRGEASEQMRYQSSGLDEARHFNN